MLLIGGTGDTTNPMMRCEQDFGISSATLTALADMKQLC